MGKPRATLEKYWLVCVLGQLLIITYLSLKPLEQLPDVGGSDKLHHFIAYSFLVLPLALRSPKLWIVSVVFLSLYSGVIEILQPMVNRHGEWLDWLANNAGLLIGVLFAKIVRFNHS